ncbi:hypothetical protein NFI96_006887 [Prochilodus magdalenae]|nr:hypothetical protein NFI96_006887 [Prochilodus magdalenae]
MFRDVQGQQPSVNANQTSLVNNSPARESYSALVSRPQHTSGFSLQISTDKGNVALKAQAVQSSTAYNGPASKAVDGNLETNYHVSSCTHTVRERDPWWRVDLSRTYNITRIAITNRGDCCAERLNGAQIHVGESLINNGNSNRK